MASRRFADLLPLYRSTAFGATMEDDAEVTVATQEIVDLLKKIDSDGDAASDAGIALIDEVSDLAVGAKVKARIDLPRIALGLLAWNIGDLIAGSGPRTEEPGRYLLVDAGYTPGEDEVPDAVIRYRKLLEVVALLAKSASFLDRTRAELIFVKDGKIVLPVNFDTAELTALDLAAADSLAQWLTGSATSCKSGHAVRLAVVRDVRQSTPSCRAPLQAPPRPSRPG